MREINEESHIEEEEEEEEHQKFLHLKRELTTVAAFSSSIAACRAGRPLFFVVRFFESIFRDKCVEEGRGSRLSKGASRARAKGGSLAIRLIDCIRLSPFTFFSVRFSKGPLKLVGRSYLSPPASLKERKRSASEAKREAKGVQMKAWPGACVFSSPYSSTRWASQSRPFKLIPTPTAAERNLMVWITPPITGSSKKKKKKKEAFIDE